MPSIADPAPTEDDLRVALAVLRAGGLVAYPTETVWGLGAVASSHTAMEALRAWKGRSADAPVAVLVSGLDEAAEHGARLSGPARALGDAFWPGPVTLVLPCKRGFARGIAGAGGGVGFRCSPHPAALALARAARAAGLGPLTATSCNRSGEPPARTRGEAALLCTGPGAPHLLMPAALESRGGEPSTVVDLQGAPEVIRVGAVGREAILDALGGRPTRVASMQGHEEIGPR